MTSLRMQHTLLPFNQSFLTLVYLSYFPPEIKMIYKFSICAEAKREAMFKRNKMFHKAKSQWKTLVISLFFCFKINYNFFLCEKKKELKQEKTHLFHIM